MDNNDYDLTEYEERPFVKNKEIEEMPWQEVKKMPIAKASYFTPIEYLKRKIKLIQRLLTMLFLVYLFFSFCFFSWDILTILKKLAVIERYSIGLVVALLTGFITLITDEV